MPSAHSSGGTEQRCRVFLTSGDKLMIQQLMVKKKKKRRCGGGKHVFKRSDGGAMITL